MKKKQTQTHIALHLIASAAVDQVLFDQKPTEFRSSFGFFAHLFRSFSLYLSVSLAFSFVLLF